MGEQNCAWQNRWLGCYSKIRPTSRCLSVVLSEGMSYAIVALGMDLDRFFKLHVARAHVDITRCSQHSAAFLSSLHVIYTFRGCTYIIYVFVNRQPYAFVYR